MDDRALFEQSIKRALDEHTTPRNEFRGNSASGPAGAILFLIMFTIIFLAFLAMGG